MSRILEFSVKLGDILEFRADVIAFKHAQAFYGADRAMADELAAVGISRESLRVAVDEFRLVETRGAVPARYALFVGAPESHAFGYSEITRFASRVLEVLAAELPETKHLAMTIHGQGFGLDPVQAFSAQCRGFIEAGRKGLLPQALKRITIVHRQQTEVDALIRCVSGPELRCMAPYVVGNPARGKWHIEIPEQTVSRTETRGISATAAKKPADVGRHAFVAMPFDAAMDDVYHYGIESAVSEMGLSCERTDMTVFTGEIVSRIREKIATAAIVIADLTGANPNVCLEVGFAWGKERPTLLLLGGQEQPPLDFSHHGIIRYNSIMELKNSLRAKVSSALQLQVMAQVTPGGKSGSGTGAVVAIPSGPAMDDVYHFGIRGPVEGAGLQCRRIEKGALPSHQAAEVLAKIRASDVLVAELTDSDPNVYLELGYAWARDKPTILVVTDEQKLAYDVRGHRCLTYARIRDLAARLSRELQGLKDTGVIRVDAMMPSQGMEPEGNDLAAFEGVWRDPSGPTTYYARVVKGQLFMPYDWGMKQQRLSAYYHDWRMAGGYLIGRFTWFHKTCTGFGLYRLESPDKLVGGWWLGDDFPAELESDPSRMQDLVPEMTVSVLERDPSVSQFPDWVEEFFAAVGSDQTLDAWLTKLRDEVLRLSKKFMSHGRLFVAPSIPEDKLVNVRAKCNLSRDEPIWVLLDCTVLGSAKDCVVFTRHGIASHYKGRSILVAYEELPRLAFGTDEWDPYSAAISRPEGDARIPLAGSKISAQDFLKLVDWLQTFMRDHELEAALHGYS